MKISLLLAIAALLLVPNYPTAASGWRARRTARRPVATVNGVDLLQGDFDSVYQRARENQFEADATPTPEELQMLYNEVLELMIGQELLYQTSVQMDIDIDVEQVDQEINSLREQFETEERFQEALAADNITLEQLQNNIMRTLAIQSLVADVVVPNVSVSDSERQSFYDENQSFFNQPERVAARHILITTENLVDDAQKQQALQETRSIRQALLDGADFAETARQRSQGPSSSQGGDLGVFGRGRMVAPFEEAAFNLPINSISEIVETQFGYHIIQVTEKFPEGTASLEEVSADIDRFLLRDKLDAAVADYISELREQAEITRHSIQG